MQSLSKCLCSFLLFLVPLAPCTAARIEYKVSPLAGSSWRFDYTITNNGVAPIAEFSIYFDETAFGSLTLLSTAENWDSLVLQPDLGLPSRGLFDGIAMDAGLETGQVLSGFSVSFDYLLVGAPGSQPFDIIDPATFEVLESGRTKLFVPDGGGNGVAEPATWLLLLPTVIAIMTMSSRRRRPQSQPHAIA